MKNILLSGVLNVIGALVVVVYVMVALTARTALAISPGSEPLFQR